jgi:drug/metabolite transporter (DMT)-like permease
VFALASAVTYALYLLLAEHALEGRDAVSLLAWGFAFGAVFWSAVAPWWSFPSGRVGADVSLLGHLDERHLPVWSLLAFVIVVGTILPFILLVSALRHLPATRVAMIAMLEPVVATIVAWAWLNESLGAVQLAGAAVVLAAIVLAQTARCRPYAAPISSRSSASLSLRSASRSPRATRSSTSRTSGASSLGLNGFVT